MDNYSIKTDENTETMPDPIAYFITWPTYGTWLPGSEKGWVEYHHGWKLPQPRLELECESRMAEDACCLNELERLIVETQVAETCQHRGWQLRAASCQSNHAHLVVSADESDPKKIRGDIKAWCTRRLKEKSNPDRENWWAERGSIRWVWNQQSLLTVVEYTTEAQDRKHLEQYQLNNLDPLRYRGITSGHPSLTRRVMIVNVGDLNPLR